jgi:hypothetical protein
MVQLSGIPANYEGFLVNLGNSIAPIMKMSLVSLVNLCWVFTQSNATYSTTQQLWSPIAFDFLFRRCQTRTETDPQVGEDDFVVCSEEVVHSVPSALRNGYLSNLMHIANNLTTHHLTQIAAQGITNPKTNRHPFGIVIY